MLHNDAKRIRFGNTARKSCMRVAACVLRCCPARPCCQVIPLTCPALPACLHKPMRSSPSNRYSAPLLNHSRTQLLCLITAALKRIAYLQLLRVLRKKTMIRRVQQTTQEWELSLCPQAPVMDGTSLDRSSPLLRHIHSASLASPAVAQLPPPVTLCLTARYTLLKGRKITLCT